MKNYAYHGFFGTSSWDGMNLWTKVNGFGPDQIETYHNQGIISDLAVKADMKAFQPITVYFDEAQLHSMRCHHPADCNIMRSSGYPNFNQIGYVYLSRQLWKDALRLIALHPATFAFYTAGSYSLTLWHSSDSVHALFENNMDIANKIESLYRFLHFGFLGVESKIAEGMWGRTFVITVLYLAVYASTLVLVWRRNNRIPAEIAITCLFCLIIHAYTISVSSIIEFGENNRFRFPVDCAFLILLFGNIVMWRMRGWSRFRA
jgi:hypothetical protein